MTEQQIIELRVMEEVQKMDKQKRIVRKEKTIREIKTLCKRGERLFQEIQQTAPYIFHRVRAIKAIIAEVEARRILINALNDAFQTE